MSFKMKQIFFVLGILWTTTLPSGSALPPSPEGSDDVPNLMLVYEMAKFPKYRIESCPHNSKAVWLDKDQPNKSRGLTCDPESKYDYKIRVPFMTQTSLYWPARLTITVNEDEDAVMNFEKVEGRSDDGTVRWQKEPLNQHRRYWTSASLTDADEISLPHHELGGSGFYTFVEDINRQGLWENQDIFGTVAIIIRECPRDKYGDRCENGCPDCMYGGVCHDKTGKCVCPPGRKGHHCEQDCEKGHIGLTCQEEQIPMNEVLICLPSPYGCSCAPGFKGFRCNEACDGSHWGVDCAQSCGHCTSSECDSETGQCSHDAQVLSCAGGPLGMLRLRKEPIVIPQSNSANVTFDKNETEGEMPNGAKIEGYQVVVWKKNQDMKDGIPSDASNSPTQITSLDSATAYHLAVLVKVRLQDNNVCTENGTLRGVRIRQTSFNTTCPEELPPPHSIQHNSSLTEIWLQWEDSEWDRNCISSFNLTFEGKKFVTTNKTFEFSDLEPDNSYNLTIETCNETVCSNVTREVISTEPSFPEVEDTIEVIASGNISKITLPKVKNPSAWQYVVVTEDTGNLDNGAVMNRSLQIVEKYNEIPHNNHSAKKRNTAVPLTEEPGGWVAGKIYIQDNTTQEFTIGNGTGDNRILEANTEYNVVVVTEKVSGSHKKFAITKPVNARGKAIASGLSGILFGVLIFLILIALFAWSYKKNQNKIIVRTPEEDDNNSVLP